MQRSIIFLIMIIGLASVSPLHAQSDDKLSAVGTTTQAADLLRIIGGDRIEVIGLMSGGVDPHLYNPSVSDIEAMSEADVVIYNGLHLEGRFGEVFEELGKRDVRVYALATETELAGYVLLSQNNLDIPDPHFWFDPRNWQLATQGVAEVLAEEDPDNAEYYATNAEAYIEQLDLLYAWGVEAMALIPAAQRVLVTSHDAFQYFGDAFNWEVRGLQGISTAEEAGVGDIQDLVDFVIENQIPVLFVESSVSPRTIESVQEAAADRDWEVSIGGELYSDAMGTVGTFGGTYIGMIAENVTTVVSAYGYSDDLPQWPRGLPQPEDFELEVLD